jgi:hypothetical protein
LRGLLAASALLLACTDKAPTHLSQGGEIGNPTIALVGTAKYPDGTVAGGASVLLRRDDFLAADRGSKLLSSTASLNSALAKISVSLANVFTDSVGRFRIDSVDAGEYRIEINDKQGKALVLDWGIDTAAIKARNAAGKKDTVLATDALEATGSVHGTVKVDSASATPYVALIYGMDRVALVDPRSGAFGFSDLPAGTYTIKLGCLGRGCLEKDIAGVHVAPGQDTPLDTVSLTTVAGEDYSKWAKSAKVAINTSASGAGTTQDVYGFPLLVRLDSSNFDFSQAQARGQDIRFASASGKRLAFDIDRWDAAARKAEIWVRVDTVLANSADQAIRMYWGNPDADFYTAGAQVFSRGDGYGGVWHLAEEGNSSPHGIRDAGSRGNHGTGLGISPVSSQAAVVGRGLNFDGVTGVTVDPDSALHAKDSLTLELWVNFTSLGQFKRILSKAYTPPQGQGPGMPWTEYDLETDGTGSKIAFSIAIGGALNSVLSTTLPDPGIWYHVAATYDGAAMKLYLNGELEATDTKAGVITDYGRGLTFGKYEFDQVSNFKGKLDEVRMSSAARSPAWIKLSYENQKLGSNVVTLAP